jgi:hypothetical protein
MIYKGSVLIVPGTPDRPRADAWYFARVPRKSEFLKTDQQGDFGV